jgi:hypothetical protein
MATSKDSAGWAYDIVLSQRDGRYFLRIPELSLIVEDYDLAAAYAKLETVKQDLFARSAVLGVAVPPPRDVTLKREFWASTLPFFAKAAAVAVVGGILLVSAGVFINYALVESLRTQAQKTGRAAIQQIIHGLEDMARRDLSGEREERLRAALRGVVPILKPFVVELRPLFADAGNADNNHATGSNAETAPR